MTVHQAAKKAVVSTAKATVICYIISAIAGTLDKNGFIASINHIDLLLGLAYISSILGAMAFISLIISSIILIITTTGNKLSQKHN